MDILRELLTNLYHFNNGANQVGFALQKIILVNLNQQLKLRRNEAEEDLIISGEGIPSLPRWGLNGKADEFWTANDFEILGACYRREVENFLAYLAEHHDFTKTRKNRKQDQRLVTSGTAHKKSVIKPPIVTAVWDSLPAFIEDEPDYLPAFTEGEPDSISVHLKKSRAHFSHPIVNMNSSVFGHLVQNNLSYALKELFGVKGHKGLSEPNIPRGTTNFEPRSARESQGEDNRSEYSRSHKSGDSSRHQQRQGGGDPGDSDGDDSGSGGGNNGPHRGPRKPFSLNNPRWNLFSTIPEEGSSIIGKPPQEPQFDTKLKVDAIPTWDGNPESLRRWLLKINSLAKRSDIIFKQLGTLVPTRLTNSAEIWYYSQSVETRDRIERDWNTLRTAIGEYYMNRAFLDKQKARANRASYRDTGNG